MKLADVKWEYRVKPCPICGQKDRLEVTDRDVFKRVFETCDSSLVSMECYDCGLELKQFSESSEDKYTLLIKKLVNRWNTMPRKEDI